MLNLEPETRPTKLFAQVFTKPGNLMTGGLRRLSEVNPRLDLGGLDPGEYNVRLIGYWQFEDNEISCSPRYTPTRRSSACTFPARSN